MSFIKPKRLIPFILSLAVLFYAVPRLSFQWGGTLATWFVFMWLGFALLVVAANWRAVLGVDRQEAEQLERIQRLKRWQREEWIRGRKGRYPHPDAGRVSGRNMAR